MANTSSNSTAPSFGEQLESMSAYKAGIVIWKVVPPILILLGTVGNSLSILVLTRKSIRTSTTALYLTVLAFSDVVVLYSGLLRQWIIYQFDFDVRHVSEFGCKLNIWLVYSSLDFSAWILIAVTLERVVSAWFPHNARNVCTKRSATAFLITIGVFILGLNAHLLYGITYKYASDELGNIIILKKCREIDIGYFNFFNKVWPWIDLCAFCLIPFTVIVVGNCLILFKVIKSQRKAKSRVLPTIAGGNRHHAQGHAGKNSSMTAMLFTLNIVFLLSTSPISIYNIGYTYWADGASPAEYAELDLWWAVVNMFMYTNNSLNFLLYCLSGSKFRQEVIRIFCLNRRHGSDEEHLPSNYTRTRFDTHTPSPSPRNSPAPETPNLKERNPKITSITNDSPKETKPLCGNTLHPNDAMRQTSISTNPITNTADSPMGGNAQIAVVSSSDV